MILQWDLLFPFFFVTSSFHSFKSSVLPVRIYPLFFTPLFNSFGLFLTYKFLAPFYSPSIYSISIFLKLSSSSSSTMSVFQQNEIKALSRKLAEQSCHKVLRWPFLFLDSNADIAKKAMTVALLNTSRVWQLFATHIAESAGWIAIRATVRVYFVRGQYGLKLRSQAYIYKCISKDKVPDSSWE